MNNTAQKIIKQQEDGWVKAKEKKRKRIYRCNKCNITFQVNECRCGKKCPKCKSGAFVTAGTKNRSKIINKLINN